MVAISAANDRGVNVNTHRIIRLGILTTVAAVVFISLVATAFASWVYPLPLGETLLSGAPKEQWYPKISGDYVVFSDSRNSPGSSGDDFGDIYGLDLRTGVETRLTDAYWQSNPDISGTKAVYVSRDEPEIPGDPDSKTYDYVYCLDVVTGQRQSVSPRTYPDLGNPDRRDAPPDEPAISGTTIVYTVDDAYADDGNIWSAIYTCNVTGGELRRLMRFNGFIEGLDISGDNVVYTKESEYSPGDTAVYCYNLTTNTEKKLSNDPGHASPPAISGNRVVWGGGSASTYGIYMYDLSSDTSTPRKLTSGPEFQSFPDIDGTKVVYLRYSVGHDFTYIYSVDVITGVDTPLVTGDGVDRGSAAISGNTVAFSDGRSGNSDLYAYKLAAPNAPLTYTITPSAGAGGSITPGTVQTVNTGGSKAFTITPATGYHIADVKVDGDSVGAVTSYTFANVTASHTILAVFAPLPPATTFPTLTLSSSSSTPSYGGSVSLKATLKATTPLAGKTVVFKRWDGSKWVSLGSVVTDSKGIAVKTLGALKAKTRVMAHFAGSGAYGASSSQVLNILPKVRLTRSSSWDTKYDGHTYYYKGYIEPKHSTSDTNKVKFKMYKKGSDGEYHWKKTVSASYSYYSSSKTRWTAKVVFPSAGKWRVRAYHAADSKNAKGYSSYDYLTVK